MHYYAPGKLWLIIGELCFSVQQQLYAHRPISDRIMEQTSPRSVLHLLIDPAGK